MSERYPGTAAEKVLTLFSRGEAFDAAGFARLFTETPVYAFGNFPVELERAGIQRSAENFFSQITAVYHDIKMLWEVGDTVFVEMDVSYWRADGSSVTLACADIFRLDGDLFSELRIFMDVAPVFDPSNSPAANASVFTGPEGSRLPEPRSMRRFFAEHEEGRRRVGEGHAPKWSIAGPRWTIGEAA